MCKATVAVAMLALALLLTGPVAAAQGGGRRLLGADVSSQGTSTAAGKFAQSGDVSKSGTFSFPGAAVGAGASVVYGVALNEHGEPSISSGIGSINTASVAGVSKTIGNVEATNNGYSGTSASVAEKGGSSQGGASTAIDLLAAAKQQQKP